MRRTASIAVLAWLAVGSLAFAQAAIETYDIDPNHSYVGFNIKHFFTKVPGFFSKVKGSVAVDREHLENSKVEATIDVASITTTAAKRDAHLRSDDFFAAEKFPVMTFKSTAGKKIADDTFAVTGNLQIKDVTKEIVLKVKLLGFGPGMKGAQIAGAEASTTLDRRDFGIGAFQGPVGNEVEVVINVEADLRKPEPAK